MRRGFVGILLLITTTTAIPWTTRFNGYGLGKVERSTTGFDSFAAVDASTLKLVIDAIAKINVPNWT